MRSESRMTIGFHVILDGLSNIQQHAALLSQRTETGRPNLCLIYRVPVARWGGGVATRRGQLRKPEVSADKFRGQT